MTWELLCVAGEAAPAAVVLSDEAGLAIDIGRDPNCDVRLFDDLNQPLPCPLEKGADGFQLIDQRSRNGTWLGTQRVETVAVGDGSTFRCGDATFTLVDRERRRAKPVSPAMVACPCVSAPPPRPVPGAREMTPGTGGPAPTLPAPCRRRCRAPGQPRGRGGRGPAGL